MPGAKDLPLPAHDTDGHGAGVPVEATITLVRRGVESPAGSSSCASLSPTPAVPRRYAEAGASIRINTLQRTGGTVAVPPLVGQTQVGGGFTARR
jgi:hypothetical protein